MKIIKKVKKFFQQYLLTIFLIAFLLTSLLSQTIFLNSFDKAKQAVARWPQLAKPHLKLSVALFMDGSLKAKKELALAKKSFLKNQELIVSVEERVTQPDKIEDQINSWQAVVDQGVETPLAYLKLSLLNFSLYHDDQAQDFWEKAFYLDPNSKTVEEVDRIIN